MKSTHYQENIVIAGLVGATLLSGIVLSNRSASADVVDTISITVPSACSIRSTIATGSEHSKEISNGTYQENIGETVVKAICNDNEGFSIYAIGFTDDEYGKTVLSSSIDATHDITTGTATGPVSGADTSNWAMKLTAVDGASAPTILSDTDGSFGSYHIVPEAYAKVATYLSNTDSTDGSSFKTTYATYISKTQVADTYHGKVKYVMVHPASKPAPYIPVNIPCEPGKICYYPNANDHEGTMGQQTTDDSNASLVDGATVTLLASNFSREGYGFAGWSDSPTYDGNFYGPNETITAPVGVTENGLSLYAVWVESAGYLQNATTVASVCNNLTTAPVDGSANLESVSAFTDQRDGQTYAVARLADGNCWMIENLRLNAENSTDESLAEGFGKSTTYGNFAGLASTESSGFTEYGTANSLYSTDGSNNTIAIGSDNSPSYRIPRYNNLNTRSRVNTPTSNTFSNNNYSSGMFSYGNYYTWSAAMASTIYYGNIEMIDENGKTSETANTSICPKGWELPYGRNSGKGNESGGFYYLINRINVNNQAESVISGILRSYPNNFIFSGYYNNNSAYYRGSYGYYWSSTVDSSDSSFRLYYSKNDADPGMDKSNKYIGFSIRCKLKNE